MLDSPSDGGGAGWSRPLRYTWLLVAVAFLYVAGVVFVRWRDDRELEREAEAKARAKRAEEDRRAIEAAGGNRFQILAFYAVPAQIDRGDRAQLCYGVSNAVSVNIEPAAAEPLWPSYSRCVDVTPRADTTYTLTAKDSAGDVIHATATVRVRQAR